MNCRGCGRCCEMRHPYLDVLVAPGDDTPGELTEYRAGYQGEVGWWMRRKADGSCIAFDAEKRTCTIYLVRPEECREFFAGHPVCMEIMRQD